MGKTKYIFVTGDVASSLGEGIISSSIGKLLQVRGYKVTTQKFDPYINIDPGTPDPYEHGECYVAIDGYEADLDLGHCECFLGIQTTKANNITTSHIYRSVIGKKRRGDYLGKTTQVIPHIADKIKRNIRLLGNKYRFDFVITEIEGTVGDIESLSYLESIRQLKWELGQNASYVHLTRVSFLSAAQELGTKPARHSVKELQSLGAQPDILVLRTKHNLNANLRKKVVSFCNVAENAVVQSIDASTIYEAPLLMQEQGLDETIPQKMDLPVGERPPLGPWKDFLNRRANATETMTIAMAGKYVELQDAYKSILESLSQTATYNGREARVEYVSPEHLTPDSVDEQLGHIDGVIVCPRFGSRGIGGKFVAAKYACEYNIPTFSICLGMQCMTIEFARSVLGYADVDSIEVDEKTKRSVISTIEGQKVIANMGGIVRLGIYGCALKKDSKVYETCKRERIRERHRHRYELSNDYRRQFEEAGTKCVGINPESGLIEIIEVPALKWYIGTQLHPEYSSTVLHLRPLFVSFIKAAIDK